MKVLRQMQEAESGVPVQVNRVRRKGAEKKEGKVQISCFSGKQAVDWLVASSQEESLRERSAAIRLAQHLLSLKQIQSLNVFIEGENRFGVAPQFSDSSDTQYFFNTEQLPQQIHEILAHSSFANITAVVRKMMDPATGVQVKDRKVHFKKHRDCFMAQELTAWIMNQLQTHNRDEAIVFCSYLVTAGWVRSAGTKAQPFTDKIVPFQFCKKLSDLGSPSHSLTPDHSPTLLKRSASTNFAVHTPLSSSASSSPSPLAASSSPSSSAASSSSSSSLLPSSSAATSSGDQSPLPTRPNRGFSVAVGQEAHELTGSDEPLRFTTSPHLLGRLDDTRSVRSLAFSDHTPSPRIHDTSDGDSQSSSSSSVLTDSSRHQSDYSTAGEDGPLEHRESTLSLDDEHLSVLLRGNPFAEFILAERRMIGELNSLLDQIRGLPGVTEPTATTIAGALPEYLRFHQDVLRALEGLPWLESYEQDTAVLVRKHHNGINPLDLAKNIKSDFSETIPEEAERDRRAANPTEHHSPLHIATAKSDLVALLQTLEEHPHLVVHSDTRLWTPLHLACSTGHIGMVDALLRAGSKTNAQNNEKALPLHYFVRHSFTPNQLWRTVMRRLTEGVDINHQTITGETPLHLAALGEDTEDNIRWLVHHGADLNRPNLRGNTPLHNAIQQGRPRMVRFLLTQGADTLPCAGVSCAQMARSRPGLAGLLAAWRSVFPWWVAIQSLFSKFSRVLAALYRQQISCLSSILEAIATVPEPPVWLDKSVAKLPIVHVEQFVTNLHQVFSHTTRNPHLSDFDRILRRLQGLSDIYAAWERLPPFRRPLFELSVSVPKAQLASCILFSSSQLAASERLCLRTVCRLFRIKSSPPLPFFKFRSTPAVSTLMSGAAEVETIPHELDVFLFLFSNYFILLRRTEANFRELLFSAELQKLTADPYAKASQPTVTITLLKAPSFGGQQARFRLQASQQQIDTLLRHCPRSSSKEALTVAIKI